MSAVLLSASLTYSRLLPVPPWTPIGPAMVSRVCVGELMITVLLPLPRVMPFTLPAAVLKRFTLSLAEPVTRNTPLPKVPPVAT